MIAVSKALDETLPRIEFVGIYRYEAFAERVRFDVPVLT